MKISPLREIRNLFPFERATRRVASRRVAIQAREKIRHAREGRGLFLIALKIRRSNSPPASFVPRIVYVCIYVR